MSAQKSIELLIQEFSVQKGFYEGDTAEKNIKRIAKRIEKGEVIKSTEFWEEEASDFAVFCQYTKKRTIDGVTKKILENMPTEHEFQAYYIVVFTDTYENRAEVGKQAKIIRDNVKKRVGCGLSDITLQILTYCANDENKFLISIGNRLNGIHMPDDRSSRKYAGLDGKIAGKVEAYVFNAKLYDIVKIYNKIGDELFRKNVRYSIKEQLDVGESIKKTLREAPEDFWYLNNGITIIANDRDALDLGRAHSIGLDYKESKTFSVINGAQTISAAAQFWFTDTGRGDGEGDDVELRKQAEKAEVLLRIMCVVEKDEDGQKELDNSISISLNRQKAVKSEDIAYTNPIVLEINQLYQPGVKDDIHFCIIKRGEDILGKYQYSLIDFARCVKAYRMQKPGEARTQAANKILDAASEDSIYAKEILQSDTEIVFAKYYKPTNFAMCLLEYYKKFGKRVKTTQSFFSAEILGNGKYYFMAYMIAVLHDNFDDFTEFDYSADRINEGFEKIIIEYVDMLSEIGEEYLEDIEEQTIDSNTFKKEKLYEQLVEYEKSGKNKNLKQKVTTLKQKIRNWFS